jgi:hypothetical protein
MLVNGCDCLIAIKTQYLAMGAPYAEETIREAVCLLQEEAAIEGDGSRGVIRKSRGITGCVVTPLTIGTAPLFWCLAMGSAEIPFYVSETRNIYLYRLNLLPVEGSARFDLVQERGGSQTLYQGCAVAGFELRCNRGEAIRLRLDIQGEWPPAVYPYIDPLKIEMGERFSSDYVVYRINKMKHTNIYGITLTADKKDGTKTELWIKRALEQGGDLPGMIEELTITAQLLRDKYERRYYGMFRVILTRLILVSDETVVDCGDWLVGPLRYYVAGTVNAEALNTSGEALA